MKREYPIRAVSLLALAHDIQTRIENGDFKDYAKVARLLAWAHKAQRQIDNGEFESRSHLARHLGVTKASVSQLLDLTLLAPTIQEELLFLEAIDGKEPLSERGLSSVLRWKNWNQQSI